MADTRSLPSRLPSFFSASRICGTMIRSRRPTSLPAGSPGPRLRVGIGVGGVRAVPRGVEQLGGGHLVEKTAEAGDAGSRSRGSRGGVGSPGPCPPGRRATWAKERQRARKGTVQTRRSIAASSWESDRATGAFRNPTLPGSRPPPTSRRAAAGASSRRGPGTRSASAPRRRRGTAGGPPSARRSSPRGWARGPGRAASARRPRGSRRAP